MTTRIAIEAHCGPDKLVEITTRDGKEEKKILIEEGRVEAFYVYGEKAITIREVKKIQEPEEEKFEMVYHY